MDPILNYTAEEGYGTAIKLHLSICCQWKGLKSICQFAHTVKILYTII